MPTFCVVNCDDSTAWAPESFSDMFISKLSVEGDVWTHINIARGDPLPEIANVDGLVLTGSRFNVRDALPWYGELAKVIVDAAADGRLRIYGGCFGCQFICAALGGKIGKNPEEKFILKNETVRVDGALLSRVCSAGSCSCSNEFSLIESHGDCIAELPPESVCLASSSSCSYEMFLAGVRDNILCCQAHPEFDLQYAIIERIYPAVCKSGRLNEEEKNEAMESFKGFNTNDSNRMMNIISSFLHS